MSLILEALKKSETRRRLGEAPDIGTPFTVKARRRNPWPLIVILIAVAAGIGCYCRPFGFCTRRGRIFHDDHRLFAGNRFATCSC